ncbi:gamma-glutamyl-gamma-aminobutyrate hydrolase family protein [bacterium]|nr:gamma-glutamyl-gamma-aminobutyrate hydrolase family protein [bacterium]
MKRKKIFFFTIIYILLSISIYGKSTKPPHFIDTYIPKKDTTLLVVFHPTMYVLNSVNALKQAGFIPDNMYVVGVFSINEKADYTMPEQFAGNFKKKWLFFHAAAGSLYTENIFQKNNCSPLFKEIVQKADGAILFGGADIPPYLYEEKTSLLTSISTPFRHFIELSFVFNLLGGYQDKTFEPMLKDKPDFPFLGICLGEQSLNVGTGGTLVQDIWSEIYKTKTAEDVTFLNSEQLHRNPWAVIFPEKSLMHFSMHHIILKPSKVLADKISVYTGQKPLVISSHHQAVEKIGKNFEIAAYSMDKKVIEAIVNKKFPNVLGVQFHPEFTSIWADHSKVRFIPGEKTASISSILEKDDRSMDFHRNIWTWFFNSVEKAHKLYFEE